MKKLIVETTLNEYKKNNYIVIEDKFIIHSGYETEKNIIDTFTELYPGLWIAFTRDMTEYLLKYK